MDWLRRLTFPDRVDIVIGDVVVGRAGLVSLSRTSRWVMLGASAGGLAVVVAGAWWLVGDGPSWPTIVLALANTYLQNAWRRRAKVLFTEPVLAQGAVRAARDLGRELAPGRWRIDSPEAGALGKEFVRLHALPTPRGTGDPDLLREQALRDAASPLLRPFLQPSVGAGRPLTAIESPDVEPPDAAVPHEAGAPWPVLDEGRWPVLPRDGD